MKKTKNTAYILVIILCLSTLFYQSCDIIESPYIIDSGTSPIDTSSVVKKVLVEDFTGHRCRYCPSAARELSSIQDYYGSDKVIGIAIHPNSIYTKPDIEYTYDFRTEFGKDINMFFGDIATDPGLPSGMINRSGYNTNYIFGKDQWAGVVASELSKPPVFKIDLDSEVTSVNAEIDITITSLSDLQEEYKLVVCLTEDSIISWQTDHYANPDKVENYIHNHVLRTILSSFWGESIGDNFYIGDISTKNYSVNLNQLEQINIDYSNNNDNGNGNAGGWNYNNMNVVAYIYNTSNYEIVQVEETHLINQ